MRFSLVKLVPREILHVRIFDDVILAFYFTLRRLGHEVEFINNRLSRSGINLVFGAHIKPDLDWLRQKGPERIIVNLEQFRLSADKWAEDRPFLNLLGEHRVWDYSESNVRFMKSQGIDAEFFTLGYVPEMTRLLPNPQEREEVLFYGGINERRFRVIHELQKANLAVRCLESVYGQARDLAIFEAALALNIHRGDAANLEMARLAYLLANRKAIASERNDDTELYAGLEGACAFFPRERLAAGVIELMADKKARQRQAERGFDLFRQLPMADSLERLIGRGPGFAPGQGGHPWPLPLSPASNGRAIYSGPATDWLTPVDDLNRPKAPDVRLKSPLAFKLFILGLRLKKLRYRFILLSARGLRRFNYQRKLEKLSEDLKRFLEPGSPPE